MTTAAVSIHQASQNEFGEIAEVHHKAWQSTYEGILPEAFLQATDLAYFYDFWHKHFDSHEHNSAHVVKVGGKMAGVLRYGPAGDDYGLPSKGALGELHQIYLLPEARGHGVGKKLIAAAMEKLLKNGFGSLQIQVDQANTNARAFYEKIGAVHQKDVLVEDRRETGYFQNAVSVYLVPCLETALGNLNAKPPIGPSQQKTLSLVP